MPGYDMRRMGLLLPVVNLALLLLIAYTLWQIALALMPQQPEESGTATTHVGMGDLPLAAPSVNLDTILAARLFGELQSEEAIVPLSNLQETRLELVLTGIFSSQSGQWSRAIIKSPSDAPKAYTPGDELPGGAKLKGIQPRFVILERKGRHERLTLAKWKEDGAPGAPSMRSGMADRGEKIARQPPTEPAQTRRSRLADKRLEQAGTVLTRAPDDTSRFFRLQPVGGDAQRSQGDSEGEDAPGIKGLRYYPGTESSPLHALGARTGDLITHINGQSVKDQASAERSMAEMMSYGRGTLTIERRGKRQQIKLDK